MQRTNVQMVGAGGAIAVIIMFILGAIFPEQMAKAPTGLEGAIAVLSATLFGLWSNEDTTMVGKLPTK